MTLAVKTCVIGSQGVGKTSIIYRLRMKKFKTNVVSTIGASFSCKVMDVDSYTIKFEIWDTAGQEAFKAMLPMYYRKSILAIIVFDITSLESFNDIPKWIEELKRSADKNCIIFLIGNKCDLENERAVDRNHAMMLAESFGALYFETSAKANIGITEIFSQSAKQMINLYQSTKSPLQNSVKRMPSTVEIEKSGKQKRSCCF